MLAPLLPLQRCCVCGCRAMSPAGLCFTGAAARCVAAKKWCSCVYCDKLVQPADQSDKWCTVVGVNQLGFASQKIRAVSEVELIDATIVFLPRMPVGRPIEPDACSKIASGRKTLAGKAASRLNPQRQLAAIGALVEQAYYLLSLPQHTLLRNRTPPQRSKAFSEAKLLEAKRSDRAPTDRPETRRNHKPCSRSPSRI